MAVRHTLRVTLLLATIGGVAGSLCGLLAVVPVPGQRFLVNPTQVHGASVGNVAPLTAGLGALLGALFGPPLALSLLRHIPLWRVLLWPAAGALIGALIGRWLFLTPWFIGAMSVVVAGPLVGMFAGGVLLRLRTPRVSPGALDAVT